MQTAHINTNGLSQIAAALGAHHKLGRAHFNAEMLRAWAADAEASFENGQVCAFEIRSWDSKTGAPVVVNISAEGFDIEEVEAE